MTHPLTGARKRANLSQTALARMIGKDRLTVLRIENAQTQPRLETVAKIITALREKNVELSADAFLRDAMTEEPSAPTTTEAQSAA